MAFEIKGDSMDDDSKRSLSEGNVVLARELNKDLWRSKLHIENFPNWIIVLDNIICTFYLLHCINITPSDIMPPHIFFLLLFYLLNDLLRMLNPQKIQIF